MWLNNVAPVTINELNSLPSWSHSALLLRCPFRQGRPFPSPWRSALASLPANLLPPVLRPPQNVSLHLSAQSLYFFFTLGAGAVLAQQCTTLYFTTSCKTQQAKLNCKNGLFLYMPPPHGSPDYLEFLFSCLFPMGTGPNTSLSSTSARKAAWAYLRVPWALCSKEFSKKIVF